MRCLICDGEYISRLALKKHQAHCQKPVSKAPDRHALALHVLKLFPEMLKSRGSIILEFFSKCSSSSEAALELGHSVFINRDSAAPTRIFQYEIEFSEEQEISQVTFLAEESDTNERAFNSIEDSLARLMEEEIQL